MTWNKLYSRFFPAITVYFSFLAAGHCNSFQQGLQRWRSDKFPVSHAKPVKFSPSSGDVTITSRSEIYRTFHAKPAKFSPSRGDVTITSRSEIYRTFHAKPAKFSPSRGDVTITSRSEVLTEGSIVLRNYSFKKDSLKRAINREANRASLMSVIVPGLGQVYNRKYWKVPVIYTALGGIGYFALQFNSEYQDYHNELLYRYNNNQQINSLPQYTTANLIVLKNQSKKYRDMCFIGMGVFYVLNIIDANVDAHLRHFDVSDNLTLSLRPQAFICVNSRSGMAGGISLDLRFK